MGWEYPRLTTMTLLNDIQIKLSRLYSFINVDLLQLSNLIYFIIPVDSTNLKNFQRKFFLAKVNGLTIGNFLAPERRGGQQAQYIF